MAKAKKARKKSKKKTTKKRSGVTLAKLNVRVGHLERFLGSGPH